MNKVCKVLFILLCLSFTYLQAQTLIMGYRESARLPLIGDINDNAGIYYDIYSKAAKRLGLELKVVRLPKKRILKLLQKGEIDFYPGFTFTEPRTQYVAFLKNGLTDGGDVGLSLKEFSLITDLNQLKGKKVLTAFGGPRVDLLSTIDGIEVHSVPRLSIQKAIYMLQRKRYEFYIYNGSTIRYYLKTMNIEDMKIHPHCCGGEQPMYMGFSKKSKYYAEKLNPNYTMQLKLSADNYPTMVSENSIAYKLALTLQQMKESGEIDKILDKYYK